MSRCPSAVVVALLTLLLATATLNAADDSTVTSHQPQRPLPEAIERPMADAINLVE